MKLKERTKQALIKRTEGIISLLLILVMVPFYMVAGVLEEMGRYQSALRGMDSAVSASEVSVLAQYDSFLRSRFGLLAVNQEIDISDQFEKYLGKQNTQDTRSFSVSRSETGADGVYPLANTAVLQQQITEYSSYVVPAKLVMDFGNFSNIIKQLESYSTQFSNTLTALNSIGGALQKGMESYNAQKEAKEQLETVTQNTEQYNNAYKQFQEAYNAFLEHKNTERPEDEEGAAAWDQQQEELKKAAESARDAYADAITSHKSGISGLAKKFDTAVEKETSAFDSALDTVTDYYTTTKSNNNESLDEAAKPYQDQLKQVESDIDELDKKIKYDSDNNLIDNKENRELASQYDKLKEQRDALQKEVNKYTDSKNKNSNDSTIAEGTADALERGNEAKEVLEKYNSEACSDTISGLDDELKKLQELDFDNMDEADLGSVMDKLHKVDMSNFTDVSSFESLWQSVRQSAETQTVEGLPMDAIDALFDILSIDSVYDPNLNSVIDRNYYVKNFGDIPSWKDRTQQRNSLDSVFEEMDRQKANQNLVEMGLPILSVDNVTHGGGGRDFGSSSTSSGFGIGIIKKIMNIVDGVKQKVQDCLQVVNNTKNLAADLVQGKMDENVLLMAYLTYTLSNRTNYDSGSALTGASFLGSGGLADAYDTDNNVAQGVMDNVAQMLQNVPEETKYSFCGAELEYLIGGSLSERSNQSTVFMQLMLIESVLSLPAVATNSFVKGVREATAAALAGLIGGLTAGAGAPLGQMLGNVLILMLFTFGNGTIETLLLVNGGTTSLLKTQKNLRITPAGLVDAMEQLVGLNVASAKQKAALSAKDRSKLENLSKKLGNQSSGTSDTSGSSSSGSSTSSSSGGSSSSSSSGSSGGSSGGSGASSSKSNSSGSSNKDNAKKMFDPSKYGQSLLEMDYTKMMFIVMILFQANNSDVLLNRFVDIIQFEETNRVNTTDNRQYTLEEQLSGKRKTFDVDKAYTTIRAEVGGKFVNALPVPTLSQNGAWRFHRVIYRGY